jgi:hypothetical protein
MVMNNKKIEVFGKMAVEFNLLKKLNNCGLDKNKRFVQKIGATGACYPYTVPNGASFNFDSDKPFALITYFIKNRLEKAMPATVEYLNTKANETRIEKLRNRKRKPKIRNPYE